MTLYALDPLRDARHRDAVAARDLSDWLKWLELGNKAARTLDAYERIVAALLRAFPDTAFAEFTDGDIAHVLAKFPPRSRHTSKAAINGWFKWGYMTRRIPGNPVGMLPPMSYKPNRIYDIFNEAEADALCSLPAPDGQLMTLMFWAGIRRAEARNLSGKRLDFERRQIIVVDGAKGSKSRRVPMIRRVEVAALELVHLEGINANDYLWYDKPGGTRIARHTVPVSNTTFYRWWMRCLEDAQVRYRKPHMSRHTFATRLREMHLPMEEIQAHLGHESVSTTMDTYVHANLEALGDSLRLAVGDLS